MAKKNLIKSTTQKTADAKAEEETATKKSTAIKTTTNSTKKSAAKSTKNSSASTAKKNATPAAKKPASKKAAPKKTAAKKTATTKAKAAPKKPKTTKKVSVKELVFKKFEPTGTLPKVMPAPKSDAIDVSAPPLIGSSDPKEVERIRGLLFRRFDMDAIKADAKAPSSSVEPAPAPQTEPETATAAPPQGSAKVTAAADAEQSNADDAYISMGPQVSDSKGDPMNRAVKIAVAAAAAIVFIMLAVSYSNSTKYYIYPKDNAIEIWKGRFSPKDKAFFMVLHGTPAVEPVKETYTEKDVFPLIYSYYINKADALLEVPGLPDFEGINTYLYKAQKYAMNNEMHSAVTTRLNDIERMTLLYKADVAISKDNDDSLASAIVLLTKAGTLTSSPAQTDEIAQKIAMARTRQAELRSAAE